MLRPYGTEVKNRSAVYSGKHGLRGILMRCGMPLATYVMTDMDAKHYLVMAWHCQKSYYELYYKELTLKVDARVPRSY